MPIWKSNPRVGRKGEGGEEDRNPESEHLPSKAHRSPFARKGETLIAKMKGESPDARIPCGPVWPSPERSPVQSILKRVAGERLCLILLLLVIHNPIYLRASVLTFDSIQFWTGAGTNRAALVIQWNDGASPVSLLWGFRWSGEARGIDMLKAIAGSTVSRDDGQSTFLPDTYTGADTRLVLSLINYSFGKAVEALVFADREVVRTQNDWSTGFWEYNIYGGTFDYDLYDTEWNWVGEATYSQTGTDTYSIVNWFSSPIGASERILIDGSWDAFSYAPNFLNTPVEEPSPVRPPPPTTKSIQITSSLELKITFTTTQNINYQLESKTDLLASDWIPLGSSFPATGTESTFLIPMDPLIPKQFFRLRQLP
jgi:hypothetical protein